MLNDRITQDEDWKDGVNAFRSKTAHIIHELTLMIEELHEKVRQLESEKHNESV